MGRLIRTRTRTQTHVAYATRVAVSKRRVIGTATRTETSGLGEVVAGSLGGHASSGTAQGIAREGHARPLRTGGPAGAPVLDGRLPGDDRRSTDRVGADPAPPGDPDVRRRGALRRRHHRARLGRGDRERRREPRRAEVLQGHQQSDQARGRRCRRQHRNQRVRPAQRRQSPVRVPRTDQAVLRRSRRRCAGAALVRRDRGEDPRHRRLRRRDHRDRPCAARRRAEGDRHDHAELHRGRRESDFAEGSREGQGDASR